MNVNKINQANNFRTRLTAPKIQRDWSALQLGNFGSGSGHMGKLYPIHFQELTPGQRIKMEQDVAIQFMPFVSNLFHQIDGEILNYFVPYRLLMDNKFEDWENFITGGVDGQDNTQLPTIKVKDVATGSAEGLERAGGADTLWDLFGLPIVNNQTFATSDEEVLAFPFRAYNLIYNEHIRIPDFQEKVNLDSLKIQRGNWQWDYFTRARIFQQRGVTPTVPLSSPEGEAALEIMHEIQNGYWSADGEWLPNDKGNNPYNNPYSGIPVKNIPSSGEDIAFIGGGRIRGDTLVSYGGSEEDREINTLVNGAGQVRILPHKLENLGNYGINLNDFLQSLGIMRFQVNNAKIEARYIDHLKVRWGVFPEDARLQRPEYLGSFNFNITTEVVTQTTPGADGQTKQGHMTGQAWAAGRNGGTNYEAKEHGIVISMMIIRPKTVYEGGIERYWSKKTKFDFPTPELMNMPDRPILKKELKFSGDKDEDDAIFGYQGIYEEYRTSVNRVTGLLRPSANAGFASYTLARYFYSAPELNNEFIQCDPDEARILQYPEEPAFLFFTRTDIKEAIQLPIQSEPAELANV